MQPVTPIVPGHDLPVTNFAETQDEYLTLPAFRQDNGTVLTRWRLTWRERLRVLFNGDIYLYVLTFNRPLQPVMLETEPPKINAAGGQACDTSAADYVYDLDIANYPGKWAQAQRSAVEVLGLQPDSTDYWAAVRELFLALGGQRLSGQRS